MSAPFDYFLKDTYNDLKALKAYAAELEGSGFMTQLCDQIMSRVRLFTPTYPIKAVPTVYPVVAQRTSRKTLSSFDDTTGDSDQNNPHQSRPVCNQCGR